MTYLPLRHPQSKRGSLVEACLNTASGFLVSFVATWFVYPLFGHSFTLAQNAGIVAVFTVLSIVRSYVWRRVFVRWWRG